LLRPGRLYADLTDLIFWEYTDLGMITPIFVHSPLWAWTKIIYMRANEAAMNYEPSTMNYTATC